MLGGLHFDCEESIPCRLAFRFVNPTAGVQGSHREAELSEIGSCICNCSREENFQSKVLKYFLCLLSMNANWKAEQYYWSWKIDLFVCVADLFL